MTVGWRANRQPLLSIYLAGSQKCQVPLARFVQKSECLDLMRGLAQDFASGKVLEVDLYRERDARSLRLGVCLSSRKAVLKRPAAPSAEADSTADHAATTEVPAVEKTMRERKKARTP